MEMEQSAKSVGLINVLGILWQKLLDIRVQNYKGYSRGYVSAYDFTFKQVRQLFALL